MGDDLRVSWLSRPSRSLLMMLIASASVENKVCMEVTY